MEMIKEVVADDKKTAREQWIFAEEGVKDFVANQHRHRSDLEFMFLHVVCCYFGAIMLLNLGHGQAAGFVCIALVAMAFILAARFIYACLRYIGGHGDFEREKGDLLSYLSDLEQGSNTFAALMCAWKVMDLRNLESPRKHSLFLYLQIAFIVSFGMVAIFCVLLYFETAR